MSLQSETYIQATVSLDSQETILSEQQEGREKKHSQQSTRTQDSNITWKGTQSALYRSGSGTSLAESEAEELNGIVRVASFVKPSIDAVVYSTPFTCLKPKTASFLLKQMDPKKRRSHTGPISGEDRTLLWRMIAWLMTRQVFHVMTSCIGLIHFVTIVILQDELARCTRSNCRAELYTGGTVYWFRFVIRFLLFLYIIELCMRAYVDRRLVFCSWIAKCDFLIIIFTVLDLTFAEFFEDSGLMNVFCSISMLKTIRMQYIHCFKGLLKLCRMIGNALKPLFWSSLVLCVMILIWSVIAIQVITRELDGLDEEIRQAYGSVLEICLTILQVVLVGEAWYDLVVPVVRDNPAAILVIFGAFLSLYVGVLTVVVSAVTDRFAEIRAHDVHTLAEDRMEEEMQEKKALSKLFLKIDTDKSGNISFDELEAGAQEVTEFNERLRALDITVRDLRQLFLMLDENGDGEIDLREFIEALYRMMTTEPKSAIMIVKHYVMDIKRRMENMQQDVGGLGGAFDETFGAGVEDRARLREGLQNVLSDPELDDPPKTHVHSGSPTVKQAAAVTGDAFWEMPQIPRSENPKIVAPAHLKGFDDNGALVFT